MPCRDYQDCDHVSQSTYDDAVEHGRKLQKRADTLAQMLCEVLTFFEKYGISIGQLSKPTQAWWTEHKLRDAMRIASEQKKAQAELEAKQEKERRRQLILSATAKLTAEERKALGV